MDQLLALDTALFRVINQKLANPVFDWVMPKLAGHALFIPALIIAAIILLCKGGRRGRVLVLLLALIIPITDGFICNTIKKAIARPRPCVALADTRILIGCSNSGSMPSSHAANWFAATMVLGAFYRRSWRFMAPCAATIAFARVYDGVHYPADVFAGAVLGAGTAGASLLFANALWTRIGRAFFPLWWRRIPSLLQPEASLVAASEAGQAAAASPDEISRHWVRLGYVFIWGLLLFRLAYLASGALELSKDEAYQWLWSKHLALSYYSKPPGIALIQFAGTHLWGDNQFGVRFFSPVFATILCVVLLRFIAREAGGRIGFILLLTLMCTPLMGVGTILMTIDPPLVLCWVLAMVIGWRAVQPEGTTWHWILAGIAAGLGLLSKYSAAYLIVCWALFFILWPPARVQLRRPGPYLMLLIIAISTLPIILWNRQHDWITLHHVASNAGVTHKWKPTLRYFFEFFFSEAALLNPIFYAGALIAMAGFWKKRKTNPLWLYFFCLGAPVFLGHLAFSLRSRILPNWIAPAVVPMFCLMAFYWEGRWREGLKAVKGWLMGGLAFGLLAVVLMHETNLTSKLIGRTLPPEMDPLRRVRGWRETAMVVERARERLQSEGKPAFIIADHYGLTGLFSFYLPEARAAAVSGQPLVYRRTSIKTSDQLQFWREYHYRDHREGENAIYVSELDTNSLEGAWPWKWLLGQQLTYRRISPPRPPPPMLLQEFESVTDLGIQEAKIGKRVLHRVQLFECRGLRK